MFLPDDDDDVDDNEADRKEDQGDIHDEHEGIIAVDYGIDGHRRDQKSGDDNDGISSFFGHRLDIAVDVILSERRLEVGDDRHLTQKALMKDESISDISGDADQGSGPVIVFQKQSGQISDEDRHDQSDRIIGIAVILVRGNDITVL